MSINQVGFLSDFQRRVLAYMKESAASNRRAGCKCPCNCGGSQSAVEERVQLEQVQTMEQFDALEKKLENIEEYNTFVCRFNIVFYMLNHLKKDCSWRYFL